MTVSELIQVLKTHPRDLPVVFESLPDFLRGGEIPPESASSRPRERSADSRMFVGTRNASSIRRNSALGDRWIPRSSIHTSCTAGSGALK